MTLEDLAGRLDALERRLRSSPDLECTAQSPHPDGLSYIRGPNRYMCRCGKSYVKAGGGLLRDE